MRISRSGERQPRGSAQCAVSTIPEEDPDLTPAAHTSNCQCREEKLTRIRYSTGVGRTLMDYLVKVAESIPIIEKVMLTCFIANADARAFYEKLGFEIDALSPVERKLRFGKVFVPDYVIMSKRVRDKRKGEGKEVLDEAGAVNEEA